jgi:hypothetical protein
MAISRLPICRSLIPVFVPFLALTAGPPEEPILVLGSLFAGGPPLPCPDAADADDSGVLDITDPIAVLGYLCPRRRRAAASDLPGWLPGRDPTPDALPTGCTP